MQHPSLQPTFSFLSLSSTQGPLALRPRVPCCLARDPCLLRAPSRDEETQSVICDWVTQRERDQQAAFGGVLEDRTGHHYKMVKSWEGRVITDTREKLNVEFRPSRSIASHLKKTSYVIETGLCPLFRASAYRFHFHITSRRLQLCNILRLADRDFRSLMQK